MTLPDFAIIGAMKAGSTSLFRWLGEHPAVRLPVQKEPHYFSREERFARGLRWYESMFPELGPGQITGEASVSYTDPRVSRVVAQRLFGVRPDIRLVYLVRDPVERMRSHYRHEVQRGRERRSFPVVMGAGGERYLEYSCYANAIEPFVERFPREQLLVVAFEALTGSSSDTWNEVLCFLGLDPVARPATVHNASAAKHGYSPLMKWLYDRGAAPLAKRLPAWVKPFLRPTLLRDDAHYRMLMQSSKANVPGELVERLREEMKRFEQMLGTDDAARITRTMQGVVGRCVEADF